MLDRNYNFKEFCSLTTVNVDPNEENMFVEAGKIKLDGLEIRDVILMGKVIITWDLVAVCNFKCKHRQCYGASP